MRNKCAHVNDLLCKLLTYIGRSGPVRGNRLITATIDRMEGPSPATEQPRVTFSLATAFFVLAVFCVLLAEYQAWGVEAVPAWWFTLLPAAALFAHQTGYRTIRDGAIGVVILSLLWTMAGVVQPPRVYTWDSYCRNQLKQLALGAHLHSDRHGGVLPS